MAASLAPRCRASGDGDMRRSTGGRTYGVAAGAWLSLLVAGACNHDAVHVPPEPRTGQMTSQAEHPGIVTMIDEFHKTRREVPVAEVPPDQQFVYLKDGVET